MKMNHFLCSASVFVYFRWRCPMPFLHNVLFFSFCSLHFFFDTCAPLHAHRSIMRLGSSHASVYATLAAQFNRFRLLQYTFRVGKTNIFLIYCTCIHTIIPRGVYTQNKRPFGAKSKCLLCGARDDERERERERGRSIALAAFAIASL